MFDSEHRAGRNVRNAVALLLDCMWPQARTTTVDELTAKLKQLDAEVEAEAANEGYYLQVCCTEEVEGCPRLAMTVSHVRLVTATRVARVLSVLHWTEPGFCGNAQGAKKRKTAP